MSSLEKPAKVRKHLIDPTAPPRPRDIAAEKKSLSNVQRWVMSVLAVVVTLLHSALILLAAVSLDNPRPGAEVGLSIIAGAFGVIGIAVFLAIHKKRILSPWLLLGTLPTFVGLWVTLR